MDKYQKKVLNYYNSIESKLGYKYLTQKAKHFGYYLNGKANISESKARELMEDLVAKNLSLTSSNLVLDAGCGYGVIACNLAKKHKVQIIGIDINSFEISKAQKRAKQVGVANKVKFKVMDYTKTNFPNNHFNAIYTMETLSHAANLNKALTELLRILKPGGKLALFEYTLAPDKDFSPWEIKMLNLGIKGTAALGLKQFRHNKFPTLLSSIGFTNTKEQNITKNFLPSIHRLEKLAYRPYSLIKLLKLQKFFINTTIAVEWYKLAKKGLIRYCIFTAQKPRSK